MKNKRCQYELAVEKFFGLPENVTEKTEIKTDFGMLVNLLTASIPTEDKTDLGIYENFVAATEWVSVDEVKKMLRQQRHNCQIERNKRSYCNEASEWFIHCEDILNAEEPPLPKASSIPTEKAAEGGWIWTDELVKNYAECYRFSSSRISIEQYKKMGGYCQKAVNENYEAVMSELPPKPATKKMEE